MDITRPVALGALLLAAVAAPVGAFALSNDDNPGTSHHATHPGKGHDKAAKPEHATGEERADEASAPGREHAAAMKEWARCVAEAASGPKTGERTGPPKDACGDKPMGPGRAKHASSGAQPGPPAGKGPLQPHGKSQSNKTS